MSDPKPPVSADFTGATLFQSLCECAPVLIWKTDARMMCDFVNPRYAEFTGRPLAQQLGDGYLADIHPDDLPRYTEIFGAHFSERLPCTLEFRLRRHDGEYRWMLEHAMPMYGPGEEFLGYMGTTLDITERRVAELRQRAELEVLRTLDSSADLRAAGERVMEAIGRHLNWHIGEMWLPDPQLDAMRCESVWHAKEPGLMRFAAMSRGRTFFRGVGLPGRIMDQRRAMWVAEIGEDRLFKRSLVTERAGLCTAFGFPVSSHGELAAVFIFLSRDRRAECAQTMGTGMALGSHLGSFLERRSAELRLRSSEEQFRLMAENSTDMVSLHDSSGLYTFASAACRSLLGYEPEELIGHDAYEFFHPDDVLRIRGTHGEVLDQHDVQTVRYRLRRRSGGFVWVETTARSVRDGATGKVREIICSTRGISDRWKAEEWAEDSDPAR